MTPQSVLTLAQQGMEVMLIVAAPLLLAALVTGLLVSVLQAVTQINEATLSFLPKFIAVLLTLVIAGPWMIQLLVDYIQRLIQSIPHAIG